jgi:hypothetical protein
MSKNTVPLCASALMLALLAQGAHAGLTVTSMSQTASATASAQHSYTTVTPGPSCCASTNMVGPIDKQTDASPAGALGLLDQQTSARAAAEGIIVEAQSKGHMELLQNGVSMSSSGSLRDVFPTSVDVGRGGSANTPSSPSNDAQLFAFSAANNTRSAMSGVGQTVGFNLSQTTQLQIDWDYSDAVSSYFTAPQGISIYDANQKLVFSRIQATGKTPSSLIELAAGDYKFLFNAFNGVTQASTGEAKLDWYASASIRAVPEASTSAMMALGMAALGLMARRRSNAAHA